ncbi:Hypothetical predicted protein [Octopus vulgaris]|uniref:Uncharacterized protein n=1 Tax=Octopus vulgaris TaxID=6645 RepID=A0AA36BGM4_OCTVU|nr:Hypothetical predicted protein [Octopus vulgaris]
MTKCCNINSGIDIRHSSYFHKAIQEANAVYSFSSTVTRPYQTIHVLTAPKRLIVQDKTLSTMMLCDVPESVNAIPRI